MTDVDDEKTEPRTTVKKLRSDIASIESRAESLEGQLHPDTAFYLRWNLEIARRSLEFQLQRDRRLGLLLWVRSSPASRTRLRPMRRSGRERC